MNQPLPNTPYSMGCPVCVSVYGRHVEATQVTPNGYACCDTHADLVATQGLVLAVSSAKQRARQQQLRRREAS